MNFPDHVHVERIRTALWSRRVFGRASVMVGAGFSLNATPMSPSVPKLATWTQLSERLVEQLYPVGSTPDEVRQRIAQQALSTSGALRLAEEYEAAFGRDALDSFLLNALQDNAHEPGQLHHLLVKLPWADVLTTNYDTLLERAAARVIDRKYDVVRSSADIPGAMRPRIVKLHGSFPSTRPFIFTEEDFRTYPRRFAPFVNLAQEVAMETVLCLIGFSGDDPNFLYWTGWVRDNLGNASPQIYLCGLLDLTTARRNLLHARNVVPIDLSPLFNRSSWGDEHTRHARALEWLLLNLEAGQPPFPLLWPSAVQPERTRPSPDLPAIIEPTYPSPIEERSSSNEKLPPRDRADVLSYEWEINRALYPGWLIAPRTTRQKVWHYTRWWIGELSPHLNDMPLPSRVKFLYELNWRLELCLGPLFADLAKAISDTLGLFNPFPRLLVLPDSQATLGASGADLFDWRFAREAWLRLALARMRLAREDQDKGTFDSFMSKLTAIEPEEPWLHSRLCYEECLMALNTLDHERAAETLRKWREQEDDPFWLVRRASVYAELGEVEEALKWANRGLLEIRAKTKPDADDVAMLSREGWAMLLLHALEHAKAFPAWSNERDFRGRLERLSEYKCDPHPELDFLEAQLQRPLPTPRPEMTETLNLTGTISQSFHYGTDSSEELFIPAYQAIRLVEEAAYPSRCGNITLSSKLIQRACEWISGQSPEMAVANLFRTGEAKALAEHMSHQRVAMLQADSAARLRKLAVTAVEHGLKLLANARTQQKTMRQEAVIDEIQIALALMTALVIRLDETGLEEEFDRALSYYVQRPFRDSFALHEPLRNYLRAVLPNATQSSLKKHALALIALPLPGSEDFKVAVKEYWPDPTILFPIELPNDARAPTDKQWDVAVSSLLKGAASTDMALRESAVMRLGRLHRSNLLTPEESAAFAEALWEQTNPDTGLPAATGMHDFALLRFPETSAGRVQELFKRNYLNLELSQLVKTVTMPDGRPGKQFTMGDGNSTQIMNICAATLPSYRPSANSQEWRIDWTTDEALVFLKKINAWWEAEGKGLASDTKAMSQPFTNRGFRERLQGCMDLLENVIIPRLPTGDASGAQVKILLEELKGAGGIQQVLPGILRLFPDMADHIAHRVREGLVSGSRDVTRQSVRAIYQWLLLEGSTDVPSLPRDLLYEMGHVVSARRQPGLSAALGFARLILEDTPTAADDRFLNSLEIGLQYLLHETQYRAPNEMTGSQIPYHEIPAMRVVATRLALALSECRRGSDAVESWLEGAKQDPILHVRRAATKGHLADASWE